MQLDTLAVLRYDEIDVRSDFVGQIYYPAGTVRPPETCQTKKPSYNRINGVGPKTMRFSDLFISIARPTKERPPVTPSQRENQKTKYAPWSRGIFPLEGAKRRLL